MPKTTLMDLCRPMRKAMPDSHEAATERERDFLLVSLADLETEAP